MIGLRRYRQEALTSYRRFRAGGYTVAEAAVALWTGEHVYIEVNRVLVADLEDQLGLWMNFIRAFKKLL